MFFLFTELLSIEAENKRIYQSRIVGGFDVSNKSKALHVNILYSGVSIHSLPMCWNLLSTTLLRMHKMYLNRNDVLLNPDFHNFYESDFAIKTINEPIKMVYNYGSGGPIFVSEIFQGIMPLGNSIQDYIKLANLL